MILRRPLLRTTAAIKPGQQHLPSSHPLFQRQQPHQTRSLHARIPPPPIPSPTPFVPDASTFLTLIGRKLSAHASKIPSWEALFSLTSPQLKALGIEPPRARKYLLRWRDKFRNGEFGIGGDLQLVRDGRAEVRVVEVPVGKREREGEFVYGPRATLTRTPGTVKKIVNVDPEQLPEKVGELRSAKRVEGLHLKASHTIYGSHVEPIKGSGGRAAVIRVKEGLWEHRRGHKIDGGERRKAEVRAKRRAAERKASRA